MTTQKESDKDNENVNTQKESDKDEESVTTQNEFKESPKQEAPKEKMIQMDLEFFKVNETFFVSSFPQKATIKYEKNKNLNHELKEHLNIKSLFSKIEFESECTLGISKNLEYKKVFDEDDEKIKDKNYKNTDFIQYQQYDLKAMNSSDFELIFFDDDIQLMTSSNNFVAKGYLAFENAKYLVHFVISTEPHFYLPSLYDLGQESNLDSQGFDKKIQELQAGKAHCAIKRSLLEETRRTRVESGGGFRFPERRVLLHKPERRGEVFFRKERQGVDRRE